MRESMGRSRLSLRDGMGTGDDSLAEVVTSGTGTDADADAGEYLNN